MPPVDPGGGRSERDEDEKAKYEEETERLAEQLRESLWRQLVERMRRAWRRHGNTAMRMLFAQTNKSERDTQLHATMLQTQVRLRGEGWRPTLAIWDSGSPFTVIKSSRVPSHLVEPTRANMRWGTAGVSKPKGEVPLVLGLTKRTEFAARAIIIPDHELPSYVDALIGNDVILRVTHCNRTNGALAKQWLSFDGDPEKVELISTREGVKQLVGNFVSQHELTDLLTFHATNAATTEVLQAATLEQRLNMECEHGCCRIRPATGVDARTFVVTAAQDVIVPPAAQRMVVGRVERGELDYTRLEGDTTAVFFPKGRDDCVMWTAEFEMDGSNPDPWLPVRVCNTTDTEVRLQAGEEIGEARTDVQVMRFHGVAVELKSSSD